MSEPRTLSPDSSASPAGALLPAESGLPTDLMVQARRRLGVMSLVFMALAAVALVIVHILDGQGYPIHVATIVISAVLYAVTRSPRISDSASLTVGLVCEVLYGIVVSVGVGFLGYSITGRLVEATWTCIVIVAFPLIVPMPPWRMVLAAVATAATVPLGAWAIHAGTDYQWDWGEVFGIMISPAFCVALAYFGARVVYGISLDVARARQMGSYHLLERIGKGGMGEVWRARHRMLAREAAVKVIRFESLGADEAERKRVLARFEREAQVTAQLKSPHTVELYDFGRADDGTFYYVMEILDGLDLEAMVRAVGPLPAERVVHLLAQVCHSLHEAHDVGLVHRDIKPANIFACRYGTDLDFAKVLDFGLVAPPRQWRADDAGLTGEGRIAGTPAYMAPEMARAPDTVDGRADLYALGCVGFFLLTGRPPFEAASPLETLAAHLRDAPVAPSSLAEHPVPAGLDRIILECLQKAPTSRPEGAADLAERLGGVPFDNPWSRERSRRWWEVHRPRVNTTIGRVDL